MTEDPKAQLTSCSNHARSSSAFAEEELVLPCTRRATAAAAASYPSREFGWPFENELPEPWNLGSPRIGLWRSPETDCFPKSDCPGYAREKQPL